MSSASSAHPDAARRLFHLQQLRAEALDDLEAAELALAQLRSRLERLESDVRLGAAPTPEYQELKGYALPRAEARLLEAFQTLLKIEARIAAAPRPSEPDAG